jgi:hypothetical protein
MGLGCPTPRSSRDPSACRGILKDEAMHHALLVTVTTGIRMTRYCRILGETYSETASIPSMGQLERSTAKILAHARHRPTDASMIHHATT